MKCCRCGKELCENEPYSPGYTITAFDEDANSKDFIFCWDCVGDILMPVVNKMLDEGEEKND